MSSPPVVAGDVVVVGSAIGDNARVDDQRSGRLRRNLRISKIVQSY